MRALAATRIKPEQNQHQQETIIARFELGQCVFIGDAAKRRIAEDLEHDPRVCAN